MNLGKRKPSGREKDQASIDLLDKLREQLYSDNISTARRTAFNLSWMQEDGLDILKEALFSNTPRATKNAAAYGLRKMGGRMKKKALEVLRQGLIDADAGTKEVISRAFLLIRQTQKKRYRSGKKRQARKIKITDIPVRGKQPKKTDRVGQRKTRPS